MTPIVDDSATELQQLALQKMSAVLGHDHARTLMQRTMRALALERIRTPQELMRFSEALQEHGGFVAAVGAMLGVAAVLRGASPSPATEH